MCQRERETGRDGGKEREGTSLIIGKKPTTSCLCGVAFEWEQRPLCMWPLESCMSTLDQLQVAEHLDHQPEMMMSWPTGDGHSRCQAEGPPRPPGDPASRRTCPELTLLRRHRWPVHTALCLGPALGCRGKALSSKRMDVC